MKERPGNRINCVLCEEKEINKQKSIKRTSSANLDRLTYLKVDVIAIM